jgi:6,7-dimethyl-8-ribityllumazine synthase
VVVSQFNDDITIPMFDIARKHAKKIDAIITYACFIPGSFEMPLIVRELLRKKDVDAVVTLGAVIKGETSHDEIVAGNAARLIADLSLDHGKPVALGISGPNMTFDQARERINVVPIRAVDTAVDMAIKIKKIKAKKSKLPGRMKIIH